MIKKHKHRYDYSPYYMPSVKTSDKEVVQVKGDKVVKSWKNAILCAHELCLNVSSLRQYLRKRKDYKGLGLHYEQNFNLMF